MMGKENPNMKALLALGVMYCLLSSCAMNGPAISKSAMGNLEINVTSADGKPVSDAELYLDGAFVGNLTNRLPVIHARRGERVVRVECPGYNTYEKKVLILGDPNHQVLNVVLKRTN